VVGVIVADDVDRLAQAVPGQRLRLAFSPTCQNYSTP
jgi:allophanate hydrolase subunit 2